MTYPLSGKPTACHSPACPEIPGAAPQDPALRLGIDPLSGDYLIGDRSETGYHTLRLIAIGSLYAVNNCRDRLHTLGYARPDEWSQPLPLAGSGGILRGLTPHDVMRILTKRITLPD
ncbi:MAG: hypothetical protein WBA10_13405 [Elainellaceae cyanobacterium]